MKAERPTLTVEFKATDLTREQFKQLRRLWPVDLARMARAYLATTAGHGKGWPEAMRWAEEFVAALEGDRG